MPLGPFSPQGPDPQFARILHTARYPSNPFTYVNLGSASSAGHSTTTAALTYLISGSAIASNNQIPPRFAWILKTARGLAGIIPNIFAIFLSGSSHGQGSQTSAIRARTRFAASSSGKSHASALIRFEQSGVGFKVQFPLFPVQPAAFTFQSFIQPTQLYQSQFVFLLSGQSTGHATATAAMRVRNRYVATSHGQGAIAASIRARVRYTASSAGVGAQTSKIRYRARLTASSHGQGVQTSTLSYFTQPHTEFTGVSHGQGSQTSAFRIRVRYTAASSGQGAQTSKIRERVRYTATSTGRGVSSATIVYFPGGVVNLGLGRSAGSSTTIARVRTRVRYTSTSIARSTTVGNIIYLQPLVPFTPFREPLPFKPWSFMWARNPMNMPLPPVPPPVPGLAHVTFTEIAPEVDFTEVTPVVTWTTAA